MIFRFSLILFCLFFLSTMAKKKRNLSCVSEADESLKTDESSTQLITFDEFECRNNRTGEYNYEIDLMNGSKHKEEGYVENDQFIIRGFFVSNEDTEVS